MALQKMLVDIPAAGGLEQKTDIHRLPVGKSASAINLVKNKLGMLEKRLGFQSLPVTGLVGNPVYTATQGVGLGTWNNELFAITRGSYNGATVTALSTQSDDALGPIVRGNIPDLNVVSDDIVTNAVNTASNPCIAIAGDYVVLAWTDGASTVGTNASYALPGSLYYVILELSTGNTLVPVTALNTGGLIAAIRLVSTGTYFVLAASTVGPFPGLIGCWTCPVATPLVGLTLQTPFATDAMGAGSSTSPPFDMRAIDGDTTHVAFAYESNTPGSGTTTVVFQKRLTTSPSTVSTSASITVGSTDITGIGLRASAVSNYWAVAAAYSADTSSGGGAVPTSKYFVQVSTGNVATGALTVAAHTIYTAANVSENPPKWLDVTSFSNGVAPAFTAVWSPYGAVWGTGNVPQTAANRIWLTPGVEALNTANIVTVPFTGTSGSIVTYGLNVTKGVVLCSRGLEANGISYYIGWIPSETQGGYVALAFDNFLGPIVIGNSPNILRPVAQLQTRSALADPGVGDSTILVSHAAEDQHGSPNVWLGGSEWLLSPTTSLSTVAYVSSAKGQRLQPALGVLDTLSSTAPQSCMWGNTAAIGGGLPTIFDGKNVFEQGFLYAPESVLVRIPTATILVSPGSGNFTWSTNQDAWTWIFTWEQFDAQGNFHISARCPVTISGQNLVDHGATLPFSLNPTFSIPTLGVTQRQGGPNANNLSQLVTPPTGQVQLGVYRTAKNGSVYHRVTDRFYDGCDPHANGTVLPVPQANSPSGAPTILFTDIVSDALLTDGTHPLLYGDGSNGNPGSLDNYCPMASPVMVRHKERLFTANGNLLMWTKARTEKEGPGYNEQVNSTFVGGEDPIVAVESMDDNIVVFKKNQLYLISGDGPADDGSGSSFSSPNAVPTDAGCVQNVVETTPMGAYFMSAAGLRRLSRSGGLEYVGGPVEDELAAYPRLRAACLCPTNNRLVFAATDIPSAISELLVYDYVLDAWTTAKLSVLGQPPIIVSLASADVVQILSTRPVLHLLDSTGVVWREKDPIGPQAYYDNTRYVSATWTTPIIKTQDQGRFRLWDILLTCNSVDPHGLTITTGLDNGVLTRQRTWVWSSNTGAPSIAQGGVRPTPLTQLRTYDGRLGDAFQMSISDQEAPGFTGSGRGPQVLGFTVTIGVARGPYKLPGGQTQ